MLPIVWTEAAQRDLDEIVAYIAADNEAAAYLLQERIELSVQPASHHPYMFRSGKVDGTREIVAHPNYLVIYRITVTHIQVEAVIHARQKYPPDE